MNKEKIGLALGSGGLKGLAHVGVLKVLEKEGIKISYISGSSIGALIAAYYALYQDVDKLEVAALGDKIAKLRSLLRPQMNQGLIDDRKLLELLKMWFGDGTFRDTKIPLRIVATDLISGKQKVFSSGKIFEAVRASVSIPALFRPVKHGKQVLVDGGISNPVPVSEVKNLGATKTIAVNLDDYQKNQWLGDELSMSKIFWRSFDVMRHFIAVDACSRADIVIAPRFSHDELSSWSHYFTHDAGPDYIKLGEQSARRVMKRIRELVTGNR